MLTFKPLQSCPLLLLLLLLLLLIACPPQPASAQFNLDEMGKAAQGAIQGAVNNMAGDVIACSGKIGQTGCKAEGFNGGSGELNAPSAGYNQAICCSLKSYVSCVSGKLKEDAQCQGSVGMLAAQIDKKFTENCAPYKDVCSAGAATTTTTFGALIFLLLFAFTRLVSV